MPAFEYQARKPSGDVISGIDQAASRAALKEALAARGLLLVNARAVWGQRFSRFGRGGVRLPVLLAFTRELRHLVDTGLPMARILDIMVDRPGQPVLSEAISALRSGIEQGLPLDEAAAKRPDVFDVVFQAALRAGARTGELGPALARLEAFLTLRNDLRRKLRKAMAYPFFLLGLLVVVLAILMLAVLPRFAALYSDFGSELPYATQVLMALVRTAPLWVPTLIVGIFLVAGGYRYARSVPRSRRWLDGWFLRLPVVGRVLKDIQLVQLSYMLSMLLKAGTPRKPALEFTAGSVSNLVVRAEVIEVAAAVRAGQSLADSLSARNLFPQVSLGMIRAGEMAGAQADLLDAVAGVHEQAVDDRMGALLALIEPAMMIFVGIVLGAVIVTVYLPIFGISAVVQ